MTSGVVRLCVLVLVLAGCGSRKDSSTGETRPVVIAVDGDVDSFNPLFAEDVVAGELQELLFASLVGSTFDANTGTLRYTPMLARSWEHTNGGKDLLFHLAGNAFWSDGQRIGARDVQLSYELYGDPEVASVRQGAVGQLKKTDGVPDIAQSVRILNDTTVVFHFDRPYAGQLFDAGLPILPAHLFGATPRKDLRTSSLNRAPVSSGPFKVVRWVPMQEIVLEPNSTSTLPSPARLGQVVIRIVPDYRSRISQLQSGEVDLVADLRPEDADMLKAKAPAVEVISSPGRDYDFIGWNNIDPASFKNNKTITPHPLFGTAAVRRALTMAINREELVHAYLGKYGRASVGGVSPLFRWAYNDTLRALPFDPKEATLILGREGWRDSNGDGVLDKNGRRFSFTLKIPSGNQLRSVIATIIQKQLQDINIDVKLEQVERGTFWQDLMDRSYDAWIAGFSVPLQMQLDDLWGSDLEMYPFNLTGFRNRRVDEILAGTRSLVREADGAGLWKEFQAIVHQEQPCTFLFWLNTNVGVNKRVRGTSIGALGTLHHAWEWYTEAPIAAASPR